MTAETRIGIQAWNAAYKHYTGKQILHVEELSETLCRARVNDKGSVFASIIQIKENQIEGWNCECGSQQLCIHALSLVFVIAEGMLHSSSQDNPELGQPQKAIQKCRDLMALATKINNSQMFRKYSNALIRILDTSGECEQASAVIEQRFLGFGYNLSDWRELKSRTPDGQWKARSASLFQMLAKERTLRLNKKIDALFALLIEEKMFAEASNLLKHNSLPLDKLCGYARQLPPENSRELVHIFQDLILELAKNTSNKDSDVIIHIMSYLASLDGSSQAITFLKNHFLHQYENRQKLVRLLKKHFK